MCDSQELLNSIAQGAVDINQYENDIREIIVKSEETIQSEKNLFKLYLSAMRLQIIIDNMKKKEKNTKILDDYYGYLDMNYRLLMYKNL